MPIYVSDYIGSGQPGDLFRPRGSDQPGWSAIDFRADGGKTLDGNGLKYCLLYLPVANNDPRLYKIADVKGEDLTITIRSGLAARFNVSINYTRFDDIVADLLLRPPTNGWKPLRARGQQLAIYLGGLLSPRPELYSIAAKRYAETWDAADSGSLNADLTWSEVNGADWQIVSNQARLVGNTSPGADTVIAQHNTDTDDQLISCSLVTFTRDATGQVNLKILGRCTSTNDTDTYYDAIATISPTWSKKDLEKWVDGSGTLLEENAGATFSLPEAITLSMIDSSISGSIGSTDLGPVTDTALSGALYVRAGIEGYSTHANNLIAVDDWSVRDIKYADPTLTLAKTMVG